MFAGCCGPAVSEIQPPANLTQQPAQPAPSYPTTTREEAIPADAVNLHGLKAVASL